MDLPVSRRCVGARLIWHAAATVAGLLELRD
jgi:hypothetical protein